jgi:hypothetical protein
MMSIRATYLVACDAANNPVLSCPEILIMNIEKRNAKMFNIISIVVLAAILLTAVGGIILQRQGLPSKVGGLRISRGADPFLRPESTQTSPTGTLAMSIGIILLLVGFGILVAILLIRRNLLLRNPS